MTTTRKYFESLLDIFERLVSIQNQDFIELENVRTDLKNQIAKIKLYNLFEISFDEKFQTALTNRKASDFLKIQSDLCENLYKALGALVYSFEYIRRTTDYGRALELYRTTLPFEIVSKWKIQNNKDDGFIEEQLFFNLTAKYSSIKTKDKFVAYHKELEKEKTPLRKNSNLKKIEKKKYNLIQDYFNEEYERYSKYIFENFPEIADEFSFYEKDIRFYIVDRSGVPGESTIVTLSYTSDNRKAKITLADKFYDFYYRFHNLEEIDKLPMGNILSLFKIDDPSEYGTFFSQISIYHELLFIFIRNASPHQLQEFFIFLKKCELKYHRINEENQIITLTNNKKCKLFLDKTPNLKQLSSEIQAIDNDNFNAVVFRSYPDHDTNVFLNEKNIELLDVNSVARDHLNFGVSELIPWYIKRNQSDLKIDKNLSSITSKSRQLIERLKECPEGLEGWVEYENICIEIFEYLFQNDFRNYSQKVQSYEYDKIHRRDLVIFNNPKDSSSVWSNVKTDFNCKIIVIDFKNYGNSLAENEFYLPSKYLNLITGNFGIIISRKGIGNSAQIMQRKMLRSKNELLFSISDDDLIGMLRDKELNQDPSYRLENILFSIYQDV